MLRILFRDNRQPAVWLVEDVFRIGQDADNNLVIDEPGIATRHAEIRAENGYGPAQRPIYSSPVFCAESEQEALPETLGRGRHRRGVRS